MENAMYPQQLLEFVDQPVFCVKDGTIIQVNDLAAGRMLEPGMSVADILVTGQEQYASFSGGCLFLKVKIADVTGTARITRMEGLDVFILEDTKPEPQLQAMALASQQLREPLAILLNAADNLAPSDATARLNKGIYQLLRCINNMSDAARYQQVTMPPAQIRDVDALFAEICQKSAALVEEAGIRLTYRGLDIPIFCAVEPERLERALYNLISNAAKFTGVGGTIDVSLTRRNTTFFLCVEDSGCGMEPKKLPNVFRQYLRQPGLEDGRKGIGLGMALVLSAAAAHEGTVLLESAPAGGTKVTMTLKIRQNITTTRSPILTVDYAGERDHGLMELSEVLPSRSFQ